MTHVKRLFIRALCRTYPKIRWQQLCLVLFILFTFNSTKAQLLPGNMAHCESRHPADTDGILDGTETINLVDSDGDSFFDYVDANPMPGQQQEDGVFSNLNTGCTASTNLAVVSGGTYGFFLNAGNTYTFTACSNDTDVFPVMDAWGDMTEYDAANPNTPLLAATSTSSIVGTQRCSEFTYTSDQTCNTTSIFFLKVLTQNHGNSCQEDWAAWTLNITCSSCTVEAGDNIVIGADSDPSTTCTAGAITVPLPTFSAACDISNVIFDVNTVLPVGTFDYDGTTYNTGSGFTINSLLNPNILTIPAGVGVGTYNVTWSAQDCGGNTITDTQNISVQPVMVCNNNLNITMPTSCQVQITPQMVLAAPCTSPDDYTVNVVGQNSNIVSALGTYDVQIQYTPNGIPSGIICWGQVNVEDKLAPLCTSNLPNLYAPCNVPVGDIYDTPTFSDCSGVASTTFIDRETAGCGMGIVGDNDGDALDAGDVPPPDATLFTLNTTTGLYEGNSGTIYDGFVIDKVQSRVWTPTDGNGMTGESCEQFIYTFRPTAALIQIPDEIVLDCALGTDAADVENLSGAQLPFFEFDMDNDGTLDSIPITHSCKFAATHSTDTIPLDCGSQRKLIRLWNIFDWCAMDAGGTGIVLLDQIQVIKFMDLSAPDYDFNDVCANTDIDNNITTLGTAASPDLINTDIDNCFATTTLNAPIATSVSCGDFSYSLEVFDTLTNNLIVGSNNPLTNYPFDQGTYLVNYYVENVCNNMRDTCSRFFKVIDQQGPNLVCTTNTTVAISNEPNGLTQVCADHIAGNSTDNCTTVNYKMRVANTTDVYTECINLTCANIGNPLEVEIQACDASGNVSNPCFVFIELDDENGVCECSNLDIDGLNINPSLDLGFPLNMNNNTEVTVTASGFNGIFQSKPVGFNVLISETNNNFGSSVTYDCADIATSTNPDFTQQVFVQYTDGTISGSCYDDIRIEDQTPPTFDCLAMIDYSFTAAQGQTEYILDVNSLIADNPAFTTLDGIISDNCASYNDLLASVQLQYTPQGSTTPVVGSQLNIPVTGASVTHTILMTIMDNNAQTVSCNFQLILTGDDGNGGGGQGCSDVGFPVILCDNLFFDYSVEVDAAQANYVLDLNTMIADNNMFTLATLSGFIGDDCTSDVDLLASTQYSYTSSGGAVVTSSQLNLPITGSSTQYDITMQIADNLNNTSSCTFELTICSGSCQRLSIEGKVKSEMDSNIEQVEVELLGSNNEMVMTDEEGYFEFDAASGSNYTVKLNKDYDYLNGVSTFDLVQLSQHILGIRTLDSPYKIIAGDTNFDGKLSTFDVVVLRQLILYQITELPDGPSWRFIDGQYTFPNDENPWTETFPENYFIQDAASDMDLSFVGVKIGDLDCSSQTNLNNQTDERTENEVLTLTMDNEFVKAGEEFHVALNSNQLQTVKGIQFTLNYDIDKATFINIADGSDALMQAGNVGTQFNNEGVLTASWVNTNANEKSDTPLLILKMKATTDTSIDEIFELTSRYTRAEAYNTQDEILNLDLGFNQSEVAMDFQLLQNKPNPFKNFTTIGCYMPTAQTATLTIYDLAGKAIYQMEQDCSKGYNEFLLKREDVTSGILYYQFNTEGFTQTRKMIVID